MQTVNGTPSRALVAADVAHVAWAVNLGCLGFHVWPQPGRRPRARRRAAPRPRPAARHRLRRRARGGRELKALLDELGIAGYPKTTGNRGLHVYVRLEPRWDSYEVRSAAVAAARELERRRPDILTAAWWKEERGERIFVDYNQNAPHKTVFGAWSVRARVGAQVSTPLRWDELDDIDPDELTLATVPARLERDGDPWAGDRRRAAVARAAAGDAPARPRGRPDGRAVAARLPEAAGRAAPRRAQPRPQDLARQWRLGRGAGSNRREITRSSEHAPRRSRAKRTTEPSCESWALERHAGDAPLGRPQVEQPVVR